jgi:hypothetical protein
VSPQVLAAYAGTCEIQGLPANLVVTGGSGQWMMRRGAQPKLPLFAESETNFFLKAADAQLEFAKDASSATLHQGPRDLKGTRK